MEVKVIIDHLILCAVGFVHAVEDVFVRLVADEGEGVDLIAGDSLKAVDLMVDVLGKELAA